MTALSGLLPDNDPVLERLAPGVRIYCVGGAVRDWLFGQPDKDRDYVVVGADVESMIRAGFQAVGKDFPVFLHPVSHAEYALARTERKSGHGYKGFVFRADPSVTLEEDLSRRDLTINAIAVDHAGQIIDPFGGVNDLRAGCLRHVGPAFSEDPLRLLRLARFAARWPEFRIADETMTLCRSIVAAGEMQALVAERVWQEISTGLMERMPSRMIHVLVESGAWPRLCSPADFTAEMPQWLDEAARREVMLEGRFGLMMLGSAGDAVITPDAAQSQAKRFKAPRHCIELATTLILQSQNLAPLRASLAQPTPSGCGILLDWLMACDALRRPTRLAQILMCLDIAGRIRADEHADIMLLADVAASPQAGQMAAAAAADAQSRGEPVGPAARAARLAALCSHPRLASPKH